MRSGLNDWSETNGRGADLNMRFLGVHAEVPLIHPHLLRESAQNKMIPSDLYKLLLPHIALESTHDRVEGRKGCVRTLRLLDTNTQVRDTKSKNARAQEANFTIYPLRRGPDDGSTHAPMYNTPDTHVPISTHLLPPKLYQI